MEKPCGHCSSTQFLRCTGYGSLVCCNCGVEDFGFIISTDSALYGYCVPLHAPTTYTRLKRFRKYLNRAGMQQSANSVPQTTWDHLLGGQPYRSPASIVRRLKKAKHIRKKCYDSLPLLCSLLCPHLTVPRLTEVDKYAATNAFRHLDEAYHRGEPFVSYLYALEYILCLVGRADMLPFLNKISCRKRRNAYRERLDKIFTSTPRSRA